MSNLVVCALQSCSGLYGGAPPPPKNCSTILLSFLRVRKRAATWKRRTISPQVSHLQSALSITITKQTIKYCLNNTLHQNTSSIHFASWIDYFFLHLTDEEDSENKEDDFSKSKFGTRKITSEVLQRYKDMRTQGNDFWNQLPELKYQVTKINQFGKRQPRTLKLSR